MGGFTAHNIVLDDGTQTCPAKGWTMDQSGILRAVKRTLNLIYPEGFTGKSIVDVGCLEGGFTTEFARLGLHSTGLEVRDSNFQNCLRVKAGTNLPNLHFIKEDANNIGRYGPFDAVFACGLLYHLDWPRRFLTAASQICRRVIFLETHVSSDLDVPANEIYHLSDLAEHEGLNGRWFDEYDQNTEVNLEQMKWASWANPRSFWIQKEHLLDLLHSLQFDIVLEQFDCDDDVLEQQVGWRRRHSRVFLVGIRTSRRLPSYF
jgi:SAM-dependent methyltransferase